MFCVPGAVGSFTTANKGGEIMELGFLDYVILAFFGLGLGLVVVLQLGMILAGIGFFGSIAYGSGRRLMGRKSDD